VSVALVIQQAMRMRRIILSGCTIFFHVVIHGTIFGKKVTEHKMRVLIYFTNLSENFLILKTIAGETVINVH
jgi:hypothetical protein